MLPRNFPRVYPTIEPSFDPHKLDLNVRYVLRASEGWVEKMVNGKPAGFVPSVRAAGAFTKEMLKPILPLIKSGQIEAVRWAEVYRTVN